MISETLLQIESVSKEFPGVKALDNVSLTVDRGEVRALLGENGAGKSTLVKILSGAYSLDSGQIKVDGRELPRHYGPLDARRLGIAIIYQELSLLPNLTVAENIFLTKEPLRVKPLRMIDYAEMRKAARAKLDELNASHIPVNARVGILSLPEQQMVEIAKALVLNCHVIIMDEPTTALTWEETQRLFDMIRALKEHRVTVIYISHRLDEIAQIADRATILRDGTVVGTVNVAETTVPQIISMMTGRDIQVVSASAAAPAGRQRPVLLSLSDFSDGKRIESASLELHEDEVLGIAGLVGSGRTELARMLFGADRKSRGTVSLRGREVHIRSPKQALQFGIGYLTENRKTEGLNLGLSVEENVVITDYGQVSRYGVLSRRRSRAQTDKFIARLQLRGKRETISASLSGGNQQKVVIAKWLHAGCKVLVFDEPTRGIDVGAKAEVHSIIREFATEGRAAIVISSDVEELPGLCDRVLIMSKGRIVNSLTGEQINKDAILQQVTKG